MSSDTSSDGQNNEPECQCSDCEMTRNEKNWRNGTNQQLLTSVRESIINKPPYISGTLPLPYFCFSLFYKISKDGLDARFVLTSQDRWFQADIFVVEILTLPMPSQKNWNNLLRPVNRLLLG